jgi:hypothetical protein
MLARMLRQCLWAWPFRAGGAGAALQSSRMAWWIAAERDLSPELRAYSSIVATSSSGMLILRFHTSIHTLVAPR